MRGFNRPPRDLGRTRYRMLAAFAAAWVLALTLAGVAYAYQIVYYLGTPSAPVAVYDAIVSSQTSGYAFRLFNEATATSAGDPMDRVVLYYNGVGIGTATGTRYYVVYRNGENTRAACAITQTAGDPPHRAWVYCDTTY